MKRYQELLNENIKIEDEIKEILKGIGGSNDVKKLCAIAERIGASQLSSYPERFNDPAEFINDILPNLYDKLNNRYSLISSASALEQASKTRAAVIGTCITATATLLIAIVSLVTICVTLNK